MDFDKPKLRQSPQKPPVSPVGQATAKPETQTEKLQPSRLSWKKPTRRVLIVISFALLAVVAIICIAIFSNQASGTQPQYKTVTPSGKSISSLGGWRRVSPPDSEPVYAFVDTLAGVSITVSQQPLLKSDTRTPEQQLAELTKAFNATNRVKDTTAFIGTSAKGPQSAFLVKGSTLIMIKSQSEIPMSDWSKYIRSLR